MSFLPRRHAITTDRFKRAGGGGATRRMFTFFIPRVRRYVATTTSYSCSSDVAAGWRRKFGLPRTARGLVESCKSTVISILKRRHRPRGAARSVRYTSPRRYDIPTALRFHSRALVHECVISRARYRRTRVLFSSVSKTKTVRLSRRRKPHGRNCRARKPNRRRPRRNTI